MLSFEKLYYLFKLCLFLLFCFVGGGWLIYDGIADKKGRVTFDDVFPGAAAMAAGLLAIGLLYYLRRSSGDDDEVPEPATHSETNAAPIPAPIRDEASGKPWLATAPKTDTDRAPRGAEPPSVGWLELTPLRRQLLVTGAFGIVAIGLFVMRTQKAEPIVPGEAGAPNAIQTAEGQAQRAFLNAQLAERNSRAQELEQIEKALESGQQFAQSAETALSGPSALGPEHQRKLDRAIDDVVSDLRKLQTRLDSVQANAPPADLERVVQVREKCVALIERIARIRNTNGEAARDKK